MWQVMLAAGSGTKFVIEQPRGSWMFKLTLCLCGHGRVDHPLQFPASPSENVSWRWHPVSQVALVGDGDDAMSALRVKAAVGV